MCVCVCVSESEREREKERKSGRLLCVVECHALAGFVYAAGLGTHEVKFIQVGHTCIVLLLLLLLLLSFKF